MSDIDTRNRFDRIADAATSWLWRCLGTGCFAWGLIGALVAFAKGPRDPDLSAATGVVQSFLLAAIVCFVADRGAK